VDSAVLRSPATAFPPGQTCSRAWWRASACGR